MKAVVFEQFSTPPTIQQVPDPTPEPHGVVVKVMANGVCRSDWHGWMGHGSHPAVLDKISRIFGSPMCRGTSYPAWWKRWART